MLVLHIIIGEMHQPLHASMWMSWRFSVIDAGGQWAWVRIAPDAEPVRLHRFWDAAALVGEIVLATSGSLEKQLARDPPRPRKRFRRIQRPR